MATIESLKEEMKKTRNELHNIRKEIKTVKHIHLKDAQNIRSILDGMSKNPPGDLTLDKAATATPESVNTHMEDVHMGTTESTSTCESRQTDILNGTPIGHVHSVFKHKNGTPRQANICSNSKAVLELRKDLFTNPEHSLDGLQDYSHLWVIYVFHKNSVGTYTKAKVAPPRLNGVRVGLFSTRCPYRPNPIGLSLVKLDSIHGAKIHISGVDILDGTPVLDVKPYIPDYDMPQRIYLSLSPSTVSDVSQPSDHGLHQMSDPTHNPTDENNPKFAENIATLPLEMSSNQQIPEDDTNPANSEGNSSSVRSASWIKAPPISELTVLFSMRSEEDLESLMNKGRLGSFKDQVEVKSAVESILRADPRSTYRREQCKDRLYFFSLDTLHITCWFDDDIAEVLRIKHNEKMQ